MITAGATTAGSAPPVTWYEPGALEQESDCHMSLHDDCVVHLLLDEHQPQYAILLNKISNKY